jgi:hypothetical protein
VFDFLVKLIRKWCKKEAPGDRVNVYVVKSQSMTQLALIADMSKGQPLTCPSSACWFPGLSHGTIHMHGHRIEVSEKTKGSRPFLAQIAKPSAPADAAGCCFLQLQGAHDVAQWRIQEPDM